MSYNLKSRKEFKKCILQLMEDISYILQINIVDEHEQVINWIDDLAQLKEIFNKKDVTVDDVNFVTTLCDELNLEWHVDVL